MTKLNRQAKREINQHAHAVTWRWYVRRLHRLQREAPGRARKPQARLDARRFYERLRDRLRREAMRRHDQTPIQTDKD